MVKHVVFFLVLVFLVGCCPPKVVDHEFNPVEQEYWKNTKPTWHCWLKYYNVRQYKFVPGPNGPEPVSVQYVHYKQHPFWPPLNEWYIIAEEPMTIEDRKNPAVLEYVEKYKNNSYWNTSLKK
jgi:hypothetical protein